MDKGRTYKVLFQYTAGNGRKVVRVFRGRYLGHSQNGEQFDLRPSAGTMTLQKSDIIEAIEFSRMPAFAPRKRANFDLEFISNRF